MLWRRIVFSVLISNTDDHLRNHGFLYAGPLGWRLSPAYDVNPVPTDIKPRDLKQALQLISRFKAGTSTNGRNCAKRTL
jgi:serine/threonine-protein kinase HipA